MEDDRVYQLPVDAIVPGPNDRLDFDDPAVKAHVESLARSIARDGLRQPITVRPKGERYEIIMGECRWRAHVLMQRATIPAMIRDLDDREASRAMFLENHKRRDLNPIEEAKAFRKRMEQFGLTVKEVAEELDVTWQLVESRLYLLDLIPEIQKLVAARHMPLGYAEKMRGLDKFFQLRAMEYFGAGMDGARKGVKRPNVQEFMQFCSALLEKQNQATLWNADQMADFMAKPIEYLVDEAAILHEDLQSKDKLRAQIGYWKGETARLREEIADLEHENNELVETIKRLTAVVERHMDMVQGAPRRVH